MLADHLLKTKKEYKNLKKQEIEDIIKTNWIKHVFNMTWLMEILRIYLEESASDKVLDDKALNIAKI